jgi:hypothetical protein
MYGAKYEENHKIYSTEDKMNKHSTAVNKFASKRGVQGLGTTA